MVFTLTFITILAFIVSLLLPKAKPPIKSHLLDVYEKEDNIIEIPIYISEEVNGYIPDYILQRRIEKLTPEQEEQVFWCTKLDGNYFVAGFQYNEGPTIKKKLKKGEELRLERDFENKFDKNAVKVMFYGFHLGFLPSEHAKNFARKMDEENIEFKAYINYFDNSERKAFYKLNIHINEI
jgi:hypothetical protein